MKSTIQHLPIRALASFSIALLILATVGPNTGHAQSTSVRKQIAELSQRFSELEKKYNLMKLEVENLTAENNRLKQKMARLQNDDDRPKVASLIDAKLEAHRDDTEAYVKAQYDKVLKLLSRKIENVSLASASTPGRVSQSSSSSTTTSSIKKDFPKNGVVYTVQPGDTLSKIAGQYGSTIEYIQNANNLADPNTVKVGQKLFIPIDKN